MATTRRLDAAATAQWIALAAVVAAVATLVISGIRTSQAEVTASTSSAGLFSAGTIELDQVGESVALLFDEDLLYPGLDTEACVEVVYRGSIPAEVRVFAQATGGTGLDQYLELTLWTDDNPCPVDDGSGEPVFDSTLFELWSNHGTYDDGLTLGAVRNGESITLMARAVLMDDPAAAGTYTDFSMVVEARP